MEGAWLARARWRRRGAWLWPTFLSLTVADAVIGHLLPPAGETQTVLGAALIGLFLNLIAVVLLSVPLGALLRRVRPDLPKIVARDYGGTAAIAAAAAALLIAGLAHRASILAHHRAMEDAISRAQAFIGDHAPAEFRRNVQFVSTVVIEPGSMYRTCVPSASDPRRTYCVIVKTHLPLAQSVSFDGYESNAVFSQGTG
jgi:hypothetical protein